MPRSRFRILALPCIAVMVIGFIFTGTAAGITQPTATHAVSGKIALQPSLETKTETPDSDTSLLTRDELYDSVVDEARNETNASLYFVAENGTWYHAYSDGTVGEPAPSGDVIPNIEVVLDNGTEVNETADIQSSERPIYVWKVVGDCGTTLYNASDGTAIAAYPIPGCSVPMPPSETPATTGQSGMDETDSRSPTVTDTSVTGTTPGFGMGVSITAIVLVILVRVRQ